MSPILPNVIAFYRTRHAYSTRIRYCARTLFRKGTYGRTLSLTFIEGVCSNLINGALAIFFASDSMSQAKNGVCD